MNQVFTPPHSQKARDSQLDAYRALIMIFIPCIIHVMFWIDKAGEPYRSILLFEMPLIFYISGASIHIANKQRSLWETAKNRFKRILIPYYWYTLACLILTIGIMLYEQNPDYLSPKSLICLATAQNANLPIPFIASHLWFVVPYLIVACLSPITIKVIGKSKSWFILSCYLFLLLLTEPLWDLHSSRLFTIIREAVYYNFFFIAGYLTYKRTTIKQTIVVAGVVSVIFIALLMNAIHVEDTFHMQNHKFPPDVLFISFGILVIALFSLVLRHIVIPENRILNFWNKHGYSLYLWQPFSFCILYVLNLATPLKSLNQYPLADFIVSAILIFVFEYMILYTLIKAKSMLYSLFRIKLL